MDREKPLTETKVKEQNTGAEIYTENDIEEVRMILSRVRARSNNRRVALKQLHKAHQLTIRACEQVAQQNQKLLEQAFELSAENSRLRAELALRPYREQQKHWWSRLFHVDSPPQRIGYLD